jgi:hypothetical protein
LISGEIKAGDEIKLDLGENKEVMISG